MLGPGQIACEAYLNSAALNATILMSTSSMIAEELVVQSPINNLEEVIESI